RPLRRGTGDDAHRGRSDLRGHARRALLLRPDGEGALDPGVPGSGLRQRGPRLPGQRPPGRRGVALSALHPPPSHATLRAPMERSAMTNATHNPDAVQCKPVEVVVGEKGVERAIKHLKRKMAAEGIIRELKRRRHYMKPSVRRRKKESEAARRRRKREKQIEGR